MSVWRKRKERGRESELIVLAVCWVIWFSLIFRLLSLVVVTDAVWRWDRSRFHLQRPAPSPPVWGFGLDIQTKHQCMWAQIQPVCLLMKFPTLRLLQRSILWLSLLQINDLLCTLTHIYMQANSRAAPQFLLLAQTLFISSAMWLSSNSSKTQFFFGCCCFAFFSHSFRGSLRQHKWTATG